MSWICRTHCEGQTQDLGQMLAQALAPGTVVGLVGPLGAGKTRLVKFIAEALGAERDKINSPTFVLIQEYQARLPLYHFDTYRLRDADEFLELGAEELFSGEGICLIEWANRFAEVLPADTLWIEIRVISPTIREWSFQGSGANPEQVIHHLSTNWRPVDPETEAES